MKILYKVPEEFHPEAKIFMSDLVIQLNKGDLMTPLDAGALNLLGDAYDKYFKSRDILRKQGFMIFDNGHQKPHPALKICHESQVEVMKLLIEFQLTPKRRKKSAMPEKKEPVSPIDKFINGHREVR